MTIPSAPRQPNFMAGYSARASSSKSNNSSSATGSAWVPERRISSRISTARSSAARPRYNSDSIGTTVSSGIGTGSLNGFDPSRSSVAIVESISAAADPADPLVGAGTGSGTGGTGRALGNGVSRAANSTPGASSPE